MNEKERARRIVDELLLYCFDSDINHIHLDIAYEKKQLMIQLQGTAQDRPSHIDEFFDMLNTPRNSGLEGYYDELLGGHKETHNIQDFRLLGMMIDQVELSYEKPIFKLKVIRSFS